LQIWRLQKKERKIKELLNYTRVSGLPVYSLVNVTKHSIIEAQHYVQFFINDVYTHLRVEAFFAN